MNKDATSPEKSYVYAACRQLPVVRCNWVCHKPDDPDVNPGVAQPDVGAALKLGVTPMCARCAHA